MDAQYLQKWKVQISLSNQSTIFRSDPPHTMAAATPAVAEPQTSADYYFDSYSHYTIHEEMLRDEVRTLTYRNAINACDLEGKTVLDLGCGTGIMAIFCAKKGAKKVYAVDSSDIVLTAKKIVERNGLGGIITTVQSKIEDVSDDQIPFGSIDVIVSEWMGYFLLRLVLNCLGLYRYLLHTSIYFFFRPYFPLFLSLLSFSHLHRESMMDSVLVARDKFLKPGGSLYPSHATMYIAPS